MSTNQLDHDIDLWIAGQRQCIWHDANTIERYLAFFAKVARAGGDHFNRFATSRCDKFGVGSQYLNYAKAYRSKPCDADT